MKTLLSLYCKYNHFSRLLVLLLSLTAVSAACTPAAPPLVKIGLIAPFSGRYQEIGYQALYGARLALAEHNLVHLTPHYHVELIAFDDRAHTGTATEQAKKLMSDPKVVAVIGHWLEHTTVATAPLFEIAQIPMLATATVPDETVRNNNYLFRLYPNKDALLHQLHTAARTHFVEYTCNCSLTSGSQMLNYIKRSGTDATAVGGPLWSLKEFISLAGESANGSYFITPAPHPLVSEHTSDFLRDYRKAFPGQNIGWVSVHAYEATRILLATLEKSHGTTTSGHLATSLSLTDSPSSLLGPVRFTQNGEWAAPNYHLYKWNSATRSLTDN